ncbi:ureidoglycolate lyase [Aestuariivirga sp.]|uniref:ureidoglycolate lyase n=1 Tax=Aestuariivirga sp. TaxID=2650926 RepID=UPI0025BF762B|nr:ureidoglycolate lyase [Aestuariivirga sp.]MCA3556500.1 ureidoglycolate lyase [Aestuariivirga sp.]
MRMMRPSPLTREAFRPFGEVIEMDGSAHFTINQGFTERFNDLAPVDVSMEGGGPNVSLFLGQPRPAPIRITLMERHPLGSQAFIPLQDRPWLVLVAESVHDFASYRAFTCSGLQGVNYARNVWHHPLLVLDADSRFLIIDRKGPGNNLEEAWFEDTPLHIIHP